MKFKYELTKKGYRAAYKELLSRYDLIYYFVASLIFVFDMYDLFSVSIWLVVISYVAYVILLFLFLKVINLIMIPILMKANEKKLGTVYGICNCYLDDKKYTEEIDDYKLSIDIKDMKKLKKKKSIFIVYTTGVVLIFDKSSFKKESDYEKILQKFEKLI